MKKILFIEMNPMTEPLGIASIAGMLKQNGHLCDLIFLSEEKDYLSYIRVTKPDFIGFSLITGDTDRKLKVAKVIKEYFEIPIIVGGPHTTLYPEETLNNNSSIDMLCVGDGELSLLEILDKWHTGERSVKNIYFKENDKIIKNDLYLTEDLDMLPNPDRSIFYKYHFLKEYPVKRIITSYGCPYACNYCWNQLYLDKYKGHGKYYRRKSCDKIIAEIKEVLEMAPKTRRIHFHDDIFNLPNNWLEEFCDKYQALNMPYSCTVKVDLLNEDIIRRMQMSNCVGVTIGFETSNEDVRKKFLNKNITNKDYLEKCNLLNKYNIKVLSANLTNLPFEKIEDVLDTLQFNKRLGVFAMRTGVLSIWKNQETYTYCVKNNIPLVTNKLDGSNMCSFIYNPGFEKTQKLNCLFNFLYKFNLIKFGKLIVSIPLPLLFFRIFRLFDGYLEMKFFNVNLVNGFKYYLKISKEFTFFYKSR